jgi:hypothetical protein
MVNDRLDEDRGLRGWLLPAVARKGYDGVAISDPRGNAGKMSSGNLRVKRHSSGWQEATLAFEAVLDPH